MICPTYGKQIIPDSSNCKNSVIQKIDFPGGKIKEYNICIKCANKSCREMYGTEFCIHHYKPMKGKNNGSFNNT